MNISQIVDKQRNFFRTGQTLKYEFRIDALKKLKQVLKKNETKIFKALHADFNKSLFETYTTELGVIYDEIDFHIKNLKKWMKPKSVGQTLSTFPSKNKIHYEPYGVALVIGAWNYPINLTLMPAIGAISAGNCIILKPSEIALNSSNILTDIIKESFDKEYFTSLEGDGEITQTLIGSNLDKIFFTGSTSIGKKVMRGASEFLTPITLELGGKSPAIVDNSANLELAAKKIIWGKCINAGQTCVAPDYLLVHKSVKNKLLELLKKKINDFYGDDIKASPDYSRIINQKHFNRIKNYLSDGSIYYGGKTDERENFIEPTLLIDVSLDSNIMKEEIFGPVLPVLEFENGKEMIEIIYKNPHPLALYLFSKNKNIQKLVVEKVEFGGGCINDTILHLANNKLPFGGKGPSGMSSYHGKHSFNVFSHKKSVLKKINLFDPWFVYPPYEGKLKWIKKILK